MMERTQRIWLTVRVKIEFVTESPRNWEIKRLVWKGMQNSLSGFKLTWSSKLGVLNVGLCVLCTLHTSSVALCVVVASWWNTVVYLMRMFFVYIRQDDRHASTFCWTGCYRVGEVNGFDASCVAPLWMNNSWQNYCLGVRTRDLMVG